jgi:hypothetical protein
MVAAMWSVFSLQAENLINEEPSRANRSMGTASRSQIVAPADNPPMKNHVRIQPYIPRDLYSTLGAYSAAVNQTVSAVVTQALVEYLQRGDVDRDLIVRRLDGFSQPVAKLQHDLDVLARTFATFASFVCSFVPAAPAPGAKERGNALFDMILARVSRQLGAGMTLWGDLVRVRTKAQSASLTPDVRAEKKP